MHQHNYEIIQFYNLTNEDKSITPKTHKLDLKGEKEKLKEKIDSTKYRQAIGKIVYLMVYSRIDMLCSIYTIRIHKRSQRKTLEVCQTTT